ncbi:hypothetical protein [Stella sp.]|uniref:hypothetical protein n=1 Tax=Stella sp. TaxID=2912054 RepID=UPI0035AE723C
MAFAIKAPIADPGAEVFEFPAHRTMYGGKRIAAGDRLFLFASERAGGRGLFARGIVTGAEPLPRTPGVARQTPRVHLRVRRTALAVRPLGRAELPRRSDWSDGSPAAEIDFKFYRQGTDKIVGLSDAAAAFLDGFFR